MRFVLTGTFHSLNRGDSAMQLAAAAALRRRWPQATIAIHSPNADDDRELYREFKVVPCSRRRPLAALRAIARAAAWRATGGRLPLSPELQSYRTATAVVDLSGDGLTETFGWRCPFSHTVPLLLAHLLRAPFCLMAQTIGPFRRFRPWYHWVLSRAAFIAARDKETFDYLSAWKLPCPVEQTADLAFLLEPAPADYARRHIQSLGPFDPSRPLIGVTPSNLYNVRSAETPGASPDSSFRYLDALAAACRTLARDAQAQILIVPHVFGPGECYDDRRSAAALAEQLVPACNPLVVAEKLSPQQLKALIGCCDLFVGLRMHSVIAAVSQTVPTLAIAYSPKLRALMARLRTERFVLDFNQLSALAITELSQVLWAERATVRRFLAESLKDDVLPAASRNLEILAKFVCGNLS